MKIQKIKDGINNFLNKHPKIKFLVKGIRKVQTLSYIETEEEEHARNLITEKLGFAPSRGAGYLLSVKLHVRDEDVVHFKDDNGEDKAIILPESVRASDQFTTCTGLVIGMGPWCYTDSRFVEHWGMRLWRFFFDRWMKPSKKFPWCKVGDFICFPRHEGCQVMYRGVPMQYLPDDKICEVIEDPTYVTRT